MNHINIKDNNFTPNPILLPQKVETNKVIDFPDVSSAITPNTDPTDPKISKPINALPLVMPNAEEIKKEGSKIETYINFALSLDSENTGTQEILHSMIPGIIEEITREESATSDNSTLPVCIDHLEFSPHLSSPYSLPEKFIKGLPGLKFGVVGVNILSRASSALALKMLLDKIEVTIAAKEEYKNFVLDEKEKEILTKEIDTLKSWVAVYSKLFSEMLKDSVIKSSFSLPKVISRITAIAKAPLLIGKVIGWVGLGIGFISSALSLYFNNKNIDDYETWTTLFSDKGKTVEEILQTQKEIFKKRKKLNRPQLDNLLKTIHQDLESAKEATSAIKERAFNESIKKLAAVGITLSEDISTLEALQEAIANPSTKKPMNVMMVKKKEMLSVSLRNSLKAFVQKKNKIDGAFLQNARNKALILFTESFIYSLAIITLKILFAVGVIATMSTVLTSLGYGSIAIVLGLMALGTYYLYLKKPNIFKTYVQGVQVRLAFWKIPLAIQNYRKNCNVLKNIKISEEIKTIWTKIHLLDRFEKLSDVKIQQRSLEYRQELLNTVQLKKEELKLLDENIKGLNEWVDYFENKAKPLQERIDEAGGKDFLYHLHGGVELDSDTKIELSDLSKPHSKKYKNDFYLLAEHLIEDATIINDEKTVKILSLMGIDLTDLSRENIESAIDTVAKKIRAFFAMETEDTLSFIEDQKLLEKHGL